MSSSRFIGYALATAALVIAVPACGEEASTDHGPTKPGQAYEDALPIADPAGRLVVAEVNGMPVYDDCVATQAAAHGLDRQAALAECIDFELLAQEAAARGLAADPEVRRTGKTESVRRLIDTAFVSRYPDPDNMDRALLEKAYQELRPKRYSRPEIRHTTHALVMLENEPEGTPLDRAAEALAHEIYEALKDRRDLTVEEFFRIAEEVAGERNIVREGPFAVLRDSNYAKSFVDVTLALPETGIVSRPVRSHVGWHVIMVTRIDPGVDVSLEEAKSEVFQYLRVRLYREWVSGFLEQAQLQLDQNALAWLQALEDRERFAEPVVP